MEPSETKKSRVINKSSCGTGGAKKPMAKKPAAKKPMPAKAKKPVAKKSKAKKGGSIIEEKEPASKGGSVLSDVSKLAVPFGLIAAKSSLEAFLKNRKSLKKPAAPVKPPVKPPVKAPVKPKA